LQPGKERRKKLTGDEKDEAGGFKKPLFSGAIIPAGDSRIKSFQIRLKKRHLRQ
jgi:hypothetical protein